MEWEHQSGESVQYRNVPCREITLAEGRRRKSQLYTT